MSKSRQITLRVQSSEGTKRIDVHPSDTISQLFEKVYNAFELNSFGFGLYRQRNLKDELISTRSRTVSGIGLSHGDMLYLAPLNGTEVWSTPSTSNASIDISQESGSMDTTEATNRNATTSRSIPNLSVTEDEVDEQLRKLDGKIQRKRDEKLCRHGPNGCCVHCSPLEPFDEVYLKEQNIKHLSFHSYLKKLTAGADRGKFIQLDDISCRVKTGCKDHPPWPRGICSKCQPSSITLNRQTYRHVDNVMFENPSLVERFLNYWRNTGHQRIGYLYGRYEIHTDVPLGIRAVVAAIYEPPQESTKDTIRLLPDERKALVDELARLLNLRKVGWIFTDLIADDVKKGTVKHVRNIESHFLSAQECIMAGYFQNEYPNPCRFSPSNYFGSKFVTVCVTGDDKNQVHMEGYQVSNQCMALVRDGCLVPTKDAPELGYVIESTDKQYVPDVFYKEKDSYGNEVPRLARPLPVEYLLVDVPASTPLTPQFTFYVSDNITPFPIENRLVDGQVQEFSSLCSYMQQFNQDEFLEAVSDFHLLLFIATMDMLPMKDHMTPLLEAVRSKDKEKAIEWARSEHWATVEQLISATTATTLHSSQSSLDSNSRMSSPVLVGESGIGVGTEPMANPPPNQTLWTCSHCTFLNAADFAMCEMCGLPRYT
ncbi:nuclear protein localization 4 isoform X1 [Megachile rotundata]|uniref:nuclear protein localization 4 isoform X1 n=1 Tax=Megachile rotundata TaxID=143995 RepID=UPI000614F3E4|nr:PREDICTED: nuclear protein localization protein 4 homolog isoform X1 [Megachile rotundata]XP_012147508.1 PREDICTED: nuclear protein localization protein 4 homolog isoform X1 [Megachile rotundata]XP_012147509.1 PREDICTED: nuclear protein localization protein 4 homolog isoform X1 [Megachile rotundata]XP_012147510.1 PREDICTED: nuclear protein localization protein 4 homolog isoform X1 [Megachile rotundata]XP_012147511.1 PREDICTED: nuclear protein localization protein 4 homolog isoform X1 [Megach